MRKYDLGTCSHGSKPIRCEICHPETADPCPQCARFREKMDREKMAKVIDKVANADTGSVNLYDSECEDIASALIKYLTE